MDKLSPTSVISILKRKNIAIVYTYRNETANGFGHYDYWKFNVVSDWCKAVEQLGCVPYILDVRTFGHKALNNSLPPIDYIINLNAGNQSLSTLGLVPSIAGFLGIPCLPNNTLATVAGESKALSNRIAMSHGIAVPRQLEPNKAGGILRPDNYGSSCGVSIQAKGVDDDLYQEFVPGVDLTVPLLFNPSERRMEALPGVMYIPDDKDMCWFLGEEQKMLHKGYTKVAAQVEHDAAEAFATLAKSYKIKTLCRIDTRVKCLNYDDLETLRNKPIPLSLLNFMEINAMPTINEGINFCNAVAGLYCKTSLGALHDECRSLIPNMLETTFILYCSLCAYMNT